MYRRGDVLWRRTHDCVVVLLPASGEFVTLTGTGDDLWRVVGEPGSIAELAERLAAFYAAPSERIAGDITPVVEELSRCGALGFTHRGR